MTTAKIREISDTMMEEFADRMQSIEQGWDVADMEADTAEAKTEEDVRQTLDNIIPWKQRKKGSKARDLWRKVK